MKYLNMAALTAAFSFTILLLSCQGRAGNAPAIQENPHLAEDYALIRSAVPLVHNGDVIFRNGNDEVSQAARSMNRKDTSYSHCGLVFIEHDSVFVYHSLGGAYNPSQKLRRDPIDSFCDPRENNAFGIYRFSLKPAEQDSLRSIVSRYYRAGLKFDLFFNYQSDDVMYCSEFVFKSLNQARNRSMTSYVRLDTMPYGITTDDIFLHPDCRPVKKARFL